jgi:putative hydrolases of HD superfamily
MKKKDNQLIPDQTARKVVELGKLLLAFGQTNRATYYEDGKTPESVTDHTVMVSIIGCAFAEQFFLDLDLGKISQFATVHDLVEVYAGDTATLARMSETDKKNKEIRENKALERVKGQFGDVFPWIHQTIVEYESLSTPEARFVKAIDKVMPKITHILNNGATIKTQNQSEEEILYIYNEQHNGMSAGYAHDFPEIMVLREKLIEELCSTVWPK